VAFCPEGALGFDLRGDGPVMGDQQDTSAFLVLLQHVQNNVPVPGIKITRGLVRKIGARTQYQHRPQVRLAYMLQPQIRFRPLGVLL